MMNRPLLHAAPDTTPATAEISPTTIEHAMAQNSVSADDHKENGLEENKTATSQIEKTTNSELAKNQDNTLAGAFPAWDLLPPSGFVKRISRKKSGESSSL